MLSHRVTHDPSRPDNLSSERRLTDVSAILAAGVIRLRARQRSAAATTRDSSTPLRTAGQAPPTTSTSTFKSAPESRETRLELSRRSGPDGQRG